MKIQYRDLGKPDPILPPFFESKYVYVRVCVMWENTFGPSLFNEPTDLVLTRWFVLTRDTPSRNPDDPKFQTEPNLSNIVVGGERSTL